MKRILLFLAPFFSTLSYGQFAIITDKDGHTNVRSNSEKRDNIIDSLHNGYLIYCFENSGNWTNIDYSKNSQALNGYVYKDRYTLISNYQKIPVLEKSNGLTRLFKDSIEVILTQRAFDKSRHKYKYAKETANQIESIDNKRYWGTDGEMPQTEYKSIKLRIGQHTLELPETAFDDLYEPNLHETQVNFDNENNIIYIQSMNSDGAGSYQVIWKVVDGVYKERYVTYGF
jgi:hypothetical protein